MNSSPKLTVAVSNPSPKREQGYPTIWLFYAAGTAVVTVRVMRDATERIRVFEKAAA
jgi:hypothetical protein